MLIYPAQTEVFPLDFEPILRQDDAQKNDCERQAAKCLCAALSEQYPYDAVATCAADSSCAAACPKEPRRRPASIISAKLGSNHSGR